MSHLVSYKQIEGNLRRTADNGLISLLNQKQLEDLAFKYFSAIDKKTGLPGYQCPYSGEVYTNYEDIVLEHIIPVASKGGTVLFNCIPTSKEVNGSDQKGAKHLITWWIKSKYWNEDAPTRLEKIVNYMLDGYEKVFEEYTMEEVESSYQDIESDGNILDEQEDKEKNKREEKKLLKQAKDNGIHSYLGFMLDCIKTLDTYNIDTTEIRNKLKSLEDKHIFEDIDKYQLYQNIVQKIIISRIGDDSRSYLTYTINFDIKKLIDSINLDKEEDIYNEINRRLSNIENLLQENNLSTIEYFKSLKDIQDIDIIYKNNISPVEIETFLENIKIGLDTKIEIFISMLNKGNDRILKHRNKETLEGYQNVKLAHFWHDYKKRILVILFEKLKDDPIYETARKTILIYHDVSNYEELTNKQELDLYTKIKIFINMLNSGNSMILKAVNEETLEGYPSIKLNHFWSRHKAKIKKKLFEELKDNPEYDIAREIIITNEMTINIDKQIPIFIDMLNKGNSNMLKSRNKETLEGYPNIKLNLFWNKYQDKIMQKLFEELKDNPEYNTARKLIIINKTKNDVDKQIPIFINMLNKGNSNILRRGNKETLEGYSNIKLYQFWNKYQDKIKQKLFIELKDNPEYDTAREIITTNEMTINIDKQIPIFINMLNKGNSNILRQGNKETLEGYPNIKLSKFWNNHQDKIKQKLFEELKDNPEYDIAREIITTNEMTINIDKQIPIFINMLNKGNSNILKSRNKETLEGYPNIKLYQFWNKYQDKIKQKLFIELKDNPEYNTARELIVITQTANDIDKKIELFIDMLNKGNNNILKRRNKETLEGYLNINLSQFWQKHQDKIKQKLFIELKDNPEYDIARQTVLTYFKVSSYEELELKQNKGKKLQELDKMQQELIESIKYIDEVGLNEEEQRKRA